MMNVPKLRFKEFTDEWSTKRICDVATVTGGGTPSTDNSKYWNGDIQWFTPSEIGKTKYISNSSRTITKDGLKNSSAKLLPIGTILLSSRATIGEASILTNVASTNQGFQSLIVDEKYNNEFIFYLKNKFQKEMLIKAFGSTFLEISKSNIENIKIILPTLNEQNKIANFLSLLDKKIELQTKKIEDLKLYTQSLIKSLIYNLNCNKKRIFELFTVSAGGDIKKEHISSIKTKTFCYPIYSNNLDKDGLYGYSNIYKIKENSITITGRGEIGVAKVRNGFYYPIVRLIVLIPKKNYNLKYFQEAINNIKIIPESTGIPQLTAPQISNYFVNVPTIDIQNKIGTIIEIKEKKIFLEELKLKKLQELKKGLMQNMFV